VIQVIGDSHARDCVSRIKDLVKDRYTVNVWLAPNKPLVDLIKENVKPTLKNLKHDDFLVILGGVNRVSQDSIREIGQELDALATATVPCRLIWVEAPHRFDKKIDNRLIDIQNELIKSKCVDHKWTFLSMNCLLSRTDYSSQGLHLNGQGKDFLCKLVVVYIELSDVSAALYRTTGGPKNSNLASTRLLT
jgi:hypothetical protein